MNEALSIRDASRLRVTMVVTGFPHAAQPASGIFNLRAAKALRNYVNLTVVHLRAWVPGRPWSEISSIERIPVITVTVPQLPRCTSFNVAFYRSLGWPRLRSLFQNTDLIHSVEATFAGVLASRWGRLAKAHHITQLIGGETTSILPRSRHSRTFAGWEDYLHGVACNSQALANEFSGLYPKIPNVRVIYRGVDLEQYQPFGPLAGPLANRSPVRFLFLGGFPPCSDLTHGTNTKGGETLLRAWQEAEKQLIPENASLVIAGPESNSKRIVCWRADLRDPSRVYLEGRIDPALVPGYLRSSDAVLVPSLEEGLPNVAVEASACARPVLGSDAGGIPEVIVEGETGIILPAGDVGAWSDVLKAYSSRTSELRAMGERARMRMESLFDSKDYSVRMVQLYETALARPQCRISTMQKEKS